MNIAPDKPVTDATGDGGDSAKAERLTIGGTSTPTSIPRVWAALPLVLALVAAALFVVNHRHDTDRTDADVASKIVTEHVAQLLTYDYRYLDQQLESQRGWLTGPFQSTYADLLTNQVAPVARKTKLTTDTSVVSSGIVSSKHHEVKLLVFLDVSSQRVGQPHPVQTGSRIAVTAQYVDGAWRISAMDPV